MWYEELFKELDDKEDKEKAIKMSAYMRDKFSFLGIPTPIRRSIVNPYLKERKKETYIDWNFIKLCWNNEYREFQYTALDYLMIKEKYIRTEDIDRIKELALIKSWWDTIDVFDGIVGNIALKDSRVNDILLKWSIDDNMWLRRIAIDHQLARKEKTNTELLETIICNNFGIDEFFINKAIGWSLRDYSKTNSDWVRNFIEKYRSNLSSLSIKEGSKYL
jgi:3-methyladenine DNA glycosylase AlkD